MTTLASGPALTVLGTLFVLLGFLVAVAAILIPTVGGLFPRECWRGEWEAPAPLVGEPTMRLTQRLQLPAGSSADSPAHE